MFTASGLLVRFLKVFEKGNYQSVKVCLFFLLYSLSLETGLTLPSFSLSRSGCDVCLSSRLFFVELNVLTLFTHCRPDKSERILPHSCSSPCSRFFPLSSFETDLPSSRRSRPASCTLLQS
jgi:hypothetical protein